MERTNKTPNKSKTQLRKDNIKRRKELGILQIADNSSKICRKIIEEQQFIDAKDVLVYSAANGEVDLKELIAYCLEHRKNVYFPRVSGLDMDFYKVDSKNQLEEGAFHILEPNANCQRWNSGNGVILVPGVAFTPKGDRIGYGKGFYDRYMSRFPNLYAIGIAYEWQLEYSWETEENDVPMAAIITEKRKVVTNNESGTIM